MSIWKKRLLGFRKPKYAGCFKGNASFKNKLLVDMKIINVTQKILKERMYIFRNQKVMLDFDLAEIYGYETKYFNRQIKNNYERFEGLEFMFRLTRTEVEDLVRCKKCTSRRNLLKYTIAVDQAKMED